MSCLFTFQSFPSILPSIVAYSTPMFSCRDTVLNYITKSVHGILWDILRTKNLVSSCTWKASLSWAGCMQRERPSINGSPLVRFSVSNARLRCPWWCVYRWVRCLHPFRENEGYELLEQSSQRQLGSNGWGSSDMVKLLYYHCQISKRAYTAYIRLVRRPFLLKFALQ